MLISVHNTCRDCKSLRQFLSKFEIINITDEEFLNQNRNLIFMQLTFSERLSIQKNIGKIIPINENDLTLDTYIPYMCEFKIDSNNVVTEFIIEQTNELLKITNVNNFIVDSVREEDKKYSNSKNKRLNPIVLYWSKKELFTSYSDKNNFTVHTSELENSLNNFSLLKNKFIKSISTSVGQSGGNFTINLIFNQDYLTALPINVVGSSGGDFDSDVSNYFSFSSNEKLKNSNIIKNNVKSYLSNIFSINDIVLINMNYYDNSDDFFFSVSDTYFDMIGLIDSVDVNVNSNGSADVCIRGSDLMKLIKNDGSFFFNISATNSDKSDIFQNMNSISGDIQDIDNVKNGKSFDRLRLPMGELNMFYKRNLDISTVILGTIKRLANIKVAPNELFEQWGDKRLKISELIK